MIFAFELAQQSLSSDDPQVLGINIVGPENNDTALNDYLSHMKMLSFLKNNDHYPLVKEHISLHAGEMVPTLAEDTFYRTTLADALQIVKPARIGHGLSIMVQDCLKPSTSGKEEYVSCSAELLELMKKNDIAIEVPFTSNQRLNGIGPKGHPFPIYAGNNIPVTLATDDPGILKVDLTSQFVEAVYSFSPDQNATNSILLSFDQILEFTRNSLEFSFLPGQSLWIKSDNDGRYQQRVTDCLDLESVSCNNFVSGNTKARLQKAHELKLTTFINDEVERANMLLKYSSEMSFKKSPGLL
jgi:adenosine deaminase